MAKTPEIQTSADVGEAREKYSGAAWRSRFLRAPKAAVELTAREDFVPLGSLATFKLGLKTGADDFFFLQESGESAGTPPQSDMIKQSGRLVRVRGKDGWVGSISRDDLLPAIVGPHEFIADGHRRFLVKKKTPSYYLYPQKGRLKGQLAEYIRIGELARVHEKSLVKANSTADAWYVQARTLVRSRWALPYNSAYEYGAWDNKVEAVLNGRFIGADTIGGIPDDLLGGLLLSSFALMGRLTEGMSTGSEGAFDVGPPAARKIRVPDVRRFSDEQTERVLRVVDGIRSADKIPSAPTSANRVAPLRRELDIALLMGLGATQGQSASLLDRLYASYARWRGDIEQVEDDVQVNRRAVTRSGRSRSIQPAEVTGRRVWEEIKSNVRLFPKDLLATSEPIDNVILPPGAVIPDSRPLFDEGVITGTGRRRIDLRSYDRVRYVQMLRKIGVSTFLPVPIDGIRAGMIVTAFEADLQSLIGEAEVRCRTYLSSPESVTKAVRQTEKMWLSACRATVNAIADNPEE